MAQEEGRRARKRYKNAPSYDEVKAKIDAKEKASAERKAERVAARKPLTPAERYEQEKAARTNKSSDFSRHRMTGSRGHGSEYQNTRSVREEVLSYLLDEGFASDEKSAEAILGAMSEAWVESIVEDAAYNTLKGFGYPGAIVAVGLNKLSGGKIAKPDQPKPKSTPTPKAPTVSSPGGKTGTVTVDKQYPATLNKEKGMKSTGPTGTEYFSPFVPGTTVTDPGKSRFKATSQEYERIPAKERQEYQVTPRVSDATKYDPTYKPISMRRPGNYRT